MRLQKQYLEKPSHGEPEDVVSHLMAMQAQDYFGALWAVGMRLAGGKVEKVEDAFMEGRILRTHVMRPTWHFVSPEDIRWLIKLTAPSVHQANAYMYRQQMLDKTIFSKANKIIEQTLRDEKQLTREELGAELSKQGIKAKGVRLAYIVMQAELEALICSGPRHGKQFTYSLLDERAPITTKMPDMEEALSDFALRFFSSRGPAAVNDFPYWSGLKLTIAKAGLESVKQQLESSQIDGKEYWFSPPFRKSSKTALEALLLSNYDEYGMSYKDKGAFVNDTKAGSLFDYAYSHLLIIDGKLAGSWRRERTKVGITIHLKLLNRPANEEKKLVKKAAEKYGEFLGQPVNLAR